MALSDNIWWTRKSKIQAEKRLLKGAFHAQMLLLWYSFCSVAASVYYIKFNTQSDLANVSWVVFSVLVLSISGFINGLGYKERAALIKDSYEALNSLYQKARNNSFEHEQLAAEYKNLLSICENHSDIDYHKALCIEYLSKENPRDSSNGLDRFPTKYIWYLVIAYQIRVCFFLTVLYLLPVGIFFAMEIRNVC